MRKTEGKSTKGIVLVSPIYMMQGGWIEKERGGDKRCSIDLQHIINLCLAILYVR
ncbi:23216_t:CDS:2 [Cetraspora pellucida]|uniref:23216_t:CDS:1 n=1 Tax=Cetraspora pellucida TaxID=1433469 RepID=A0A9N8Z3N2_9GLOM|nr:23216_t:CDS:2 [Cetraspora pellucida]